MVVVVLVVVGSSVDGWRAGESVVGVLFAGGMDSMASGTDVESREDAACAVSAEDRSFWP